VLTLHEGTYAIAATTLCEIAIMIRFVKNDILKIIRPLV